MAPEPVRLGEVAVNPSIILAVDADDADHSGEESDELSMPSVEGDEGHGIVHKRRGIRLKQNFD